MTILNFILLLVGSTIACTIFGALLELLLVPLFKFVPSTAMDDLEYASHRRMLAGIPKSRSLIAEFAPGIGHIIVGYSYLKDFLLFASIGAFNALIVTRFLSNPERIDWIWYLVPLVNMMPILPKEKAQEIPAWAYAIAPVTYIIVCVIAK